MTTTDEHTPSRAVAEHTPVLPDLADELAPFLAKLPPAARPGYIEGRRIAAEREQMTAEELELQAAQDRAAEAVRVRAEVLAHRAAGRWAMWCHQVQEEASIYVDKRADCDVRRQETFPWWLNGLGADQHAAEINSWLSDPSARTLWLIGGTGTGKTHAAIAAGYAAAAAAVHVRYVSQLDYLRQIRPGGDAEPNRVKERYAGTSLLVLDDFGAETGDASQFVRQELLWLLDERLRDGHRQIITTNTPYTELAATFGDRIMSRLADHAAFLRFEGKDRRTPKAPW